MVPNSLPLLTTACSDHFLKMNSARSPAGACRFPVERMAEMGKRFFRRDQADIHFGYAYSAQAVGEGPAKTLVVKIESSYECRNAIRRDSLYRSNSVISQQCNLTTSRGFCLNCAPAIGRVLTQGLLVEYSPQWVSLGGPCPSHRIRFMRGSARPFGSERNCWLR